jgi:hypothetical protein
VGYNVDFYGASDGFDDHDDYLCTNTGLNALWAWIETLPKDVYPALHSFTDNDEYKNTRKLTGELAMALKNQPPVAEDTIEVVNRLMDIIAGGDEEETIVLS